MHKTLITLLITLAALLGGVKIDAQTAQNVLETLDNELEISSRYVIQREHRIDSLSRLALSASTLEGRYSLCIRLVKEYSHFNVDSTFAYMKRCEDLAKELGDLEKAKQVEIERCMMLLQVGEQRQPLVRLEAVDVANSSPELKGTKYVAGVNLLNMLMRIRPAMPQFEREEIRKQLQHWLDSAQKYRPDDWLLRAELLQKRGNFAAAIDTVNARMALPDNGVYAGVAYNFLANAYEQMQNREMQKHYLALSSIADIRNGTLEYRSLTDLSVLLYEDGDLDRAYSYINQAMKDAVACNSTLRMSQISRHIPVIIAAFEHQKSRISKVQRWLMFVLVAYMVMLVVGLFLLGRKHRELRIAHRELDDSHQTLTQASAEQERLNAELQDLNTELGIRNEEQKALNRQLEEANRVREEYVMSFMNLSMEYLNRMDSFRSSINKIAAKRNFDELYKAVRDGRNIEQEMQMFYAAFDEAFLHIYPTFVEQFNQLLLPDCQVLLAEGERMNTELRLFALMRLGITDSTEVASFLRCAFSTVYNYRTKMRNRAKDRVTFEQDVMRIE